MFRYVIGVLACLFVLFHVIQLPGFLVDAARLSSGYFWAKCAGKAFGIGIGVFVAYRAFKGDDEKS